MARTTAKKVEGVLLRDYDFQEPPDLTPFVATANSITTRVAACATAKGATIPAETLELIERWLAAHYYTRSDKAFASKSTSGASASYQGQTGMGLEASFYGQTALDLDPSGCLVAISKRARAGAVWLGKPKSDQIPYNLRD